MRSHTNGIHEGAGKQQRRGCFGTNKRVLLLACGMLALMVLACVVGQLLYDRRAREDALAAEPAQTIVVDASQYGSHFSSEFLAFAKSLCQHAFLSVDVGRDATSIPGYALELRRSDGDFTVVEDSSLFARATREQDVGSLFCIQCGKRDAGIWVPSVGPQTTRIPAYYDAMSVRVVSWPDGTVLSLADFVGKKPLGGGVRSTAKGQTAESMLEKWRGSLEWDVLGLSPSLAPVLDVRTEKVARRMAWSPDGRLLAAAYGNSISLWNTGSGQLLHEMVGSGSKHVNALAFSPDGRLLAGGLSDPGAIIIWDVSSGALLHDLDQRTYAVCCLRFSSDSSLLASSNGRRGLDVWSVESARREVSISDKISGWGCNPRAESPYFQQWLGPSGKVWNTQDEKVTSRLAGFPAKSVEVAWSPQGQYVAAALPTTGVQVWEVDSGGSTLLWEGFDPQGVGFYANGRYLWSIMSETAAVLLFDIENPSEIGELRTLGPVEHACQSTTGNLFVACELRFGTAFKGAGELWDLEDRTRLATLECPARFTADISCAFSPDGRKLACSGWDGNGGRVFVWDVTSE